MIVTERQSYDNADLTGYVPGPAGRGTVSLVLSCLLTLILCVWQALHLNVPASDETYLQSILINTRWILTGIYAPELVVFAAWRQWDSARLLGNKIHELEPSLSNSQMSNKKSPRDCKTEINVQQDISTIFEADCDRPPKKKHKWSKVHSFFGATGGFALDTSLLDELSYQPSIFKQKDRLTLTSRGIAFLAGCGHLPNIPMEDIWDKSKANGIAKALVIVQALWMLLQVLERIAAGLPVTLLEINTVAHIFCAFLMYILWWNKPLLVQEPIKITGEWIPPILAFMLMTSEISGHSDEKFVQSGTIIKTMLASLRIYSKSPEMESLSYCEAESDEAADADNTANHYEFKLTSKESFEDLRQGKSSKKADTAFFERRPRIQHQLESGHRINPKATKRYKLAAEAIERYPYIKAKYIDHTHGQNGCIHFKSEELLVDRVRNWPQNDLLRSVGGLTVGMVLWLSNLIYGGLHALAWEAHFPSTTEKWLWRASAVYIGFCGGLWVTINYAAHIFRPLNEFWEGWMNGKKRQECNIALGIVVFICGLALCLARVFIVVEAFISIRQLPMACYSTPSWSQIFPHF